MSRRRNPSLRAQARAILNEAAPVLPTPTVPAPQPSLNERARALYEDSVVPVSEIARIVGVTERTILKYASKHNWKPRYRWKRGKAGERHRGWQPNPEFVPVKGAGARFIKREDASMPFPVGLKANDPAGAARAAQACETAQTLSARAEQQAKQERDCMEATSLLRDALALFNSFEGEVISMPRNRSRDRAIAGCARLALRRWEMALDALAESRRESGQKPTDL